MTYTHKIKRVVLIGPESSGKSTLTKSLAKHFNAPFITEIARDYVGKLQKDYSYNDVEKIARIQVIEEKAKAALHKEYLFIDTDLIITKVWFIHVFNRVPNWIDFEIKNTPRHIHLLCKYDIPWVADPLRENPDKRTFFFEWYKRELEQYRMKYHIITGSGNKRFECALNAIES